MSVLEIYMGNVPQVSSTDAIMESDSNVMTRIKHYYLDQQK